MRVFSHKFLPSSCSGCRNCCHGFHSSSALKLEDKQVSPCHCQCPLPEEKTTAAAAATTLNENVKDHDDDEEDIRKKGKLASATEGNGLEEEEDKGEEWERRRTSFPTNVLQAEEAENLDNDVDGEKSDKEGTSRGTVVVPKSILKKPSSLPGASSSSANNKRVKWMPDEQLVHVREIEDRSVYEEDENRRCLCMIL